MNRRRLVASAAAVALASAGAVVLAGSPAGADTLPAGCVQSDPIHATCTFTTPGENALVLPSSVSSVDIVATGAPGGAAGTLLSGQKVLPGGVGAVVSGTVSVTGGATLYAEVGGRGGGQALNAYATGGANGGGAGGFDGTGGGGASDVRTIPAAQAGSLESRVLVAGGGGGSGSFNATGVTQGGAAGQPGADGPNNPGGGGGAGTLIAGGQRGAGDSSKLGYPTSGSLGQGGSGGYCSGAAGGGLYGGGGGSSSNGCGANQGAGGGGGGSSLVPTNGTFALAKDTNVTPSVVISFVDGSPLATTTLLTGSVPNPSVVGQSVTVSFSVTTTTPSSFTPTGTVTVTSGDGASCSGTVAAGSCTITFATAGSKTLSASYASDSTAFQNSSSNTTAQVVDAASTTTTLTSDQPDPSLVGQQVTVDYSVAVQAPGAGTPTGTVTVSDGVDSCSGTVAAGSCAITLTTSGSRTLTATYGGEANFLGSTSGGESHTVSSPDASVSITSDTPDPSLVNTPVTVDYSVTGPTGQPAPTGTVTVSDGVDSCSGSVADGSCDITLTTIGDRTLTATYGGDSTYGSASSSGESHTVTASAGAPVAKIVYGTCTPATSGPAAFGSAALTLNVADPDGQPVTVAVTGNTNPAAAVNPTVTYLGGPYYSLTVGAGAAGTRSQVSITITDPNHTVTRSFAVVNGAAKAGTITTTATNSIVFAGVGAKNITTGGTLGDTVCGTTGNDTIATGPGNDYVYGGPGNDTISLGSGNDLACGGTGADKVNGGTGTDRFPDYSKRQGDTQVNVP